MGKLFKIENAIVAAIVIVLGGAGFLFLSWCVKAGGAGF